MSFSINGSTFTTSNNALTSRSWNHIVITFDLSSGLTEFFINGVAEGTTTLGSLSTTDSSNMEFDVGFDRRGTYDSYFGKITEASLHNIIREDAYILEASEPAEEDAETDNGDRLIVLNYDTPEDFNFVNGNIKIIRKKTDAPSWDGDGTIVFEGLASVGVDYTTDVDSFALGSVYHYRIFSQNSVGNYSYQEDSTLRSVAISRVSDISLFPILIPSLLTVSDLQIRNGNKKTYLTWTNDADSRIERISIYYSKSNYPVVDPNGESEGEIIFEGLSTATGFVHRDIDNDIPAFYTVVTRDYLGRISSPMNVSTIPVFGLDEIGIPLLEVENIHYEIRDENALIIIWDNPIEFQVNIESFFDERVLLYAAISNEFGEPLAADNAVVTMKMEGTIGFENQVANVFNEPGIDTSELNINDFVRLSVRQEDNGIIRGILQVVSNEQLLSVLKNINLSIQIFSFIPDITSSLDEDGNFSENLFEFYSTPITVKFEDPYKVELINRDEKTVTRKCETTLDFFGSSLLGDEGKDIEFISKDGSYVGASDPFYARVNLSFKGEALTASASVSAEVWDATDDVCGEIFNPGNIRRTQTATIIGQNLEVQTELVDELDAEGNPTGELVVKSFLDIPINVPEKPQGAIIYVRTEYNGFISRSELFLLFETTLKVRLTALAPIADGIDVAEQFARVTQINPDDPSIELDVSDGTIVRWALTKGKFGQDRPFYSTDSVQTIGAVLSRVINGNARSVFFGPATNVVWNYEKNQATGELDVIGERYEVSANVVFNGIHASDTEPIEIFPLGSQNRFGNRFLMEMPDVKNVLWADGEDFVKLVISRDPNNPSDLSVFSNCFLSCAADLNSPIIALPEGQIVHITTSNDVEILWGNIIESVDPYTLEGELILGEGSSISDTGSALVDLRADKDTFVYFRVNKFYPPEDCSEGGSGTDVGLSDVLDGQAAILNPCECLNISNDKSINDNLCTEYNVSGSTSVLINNDASIFSGGGPLHMGIPPTVLVPQEPLTIEIVDKRVNGISSDTFVVDGESTNEIVIKVSFADQAVPNGTQISVSALKTNGDPTKLKLDSTPIFTTQLIDSQIDASVLASYATLIIDPVTPEGELSERIDFTTTYDKSSTIERTASTCIIINWKPSDEEVTEVSDIMVGSFSAYDIAADNWFDLANMNHGRGHMVSEFVGGKVYAIGGIDSKTISQFVEEYDPATDVWADKSNIITPRFGAMSAAVGSTIYVMGGITLDVITNKLTTSRSLEAYNTSTDTWASLTDMPVLDDGSVFGISYGVCFGTAQYVQVSGENRIYILSGLREIDNNGGIVAYNDKIIYYNIDANTWHMVDVSDTNLEIYKRVSPVSFINNNSILVSTGAFVREDEPRGDLLYSTDSYRVITTTNTFEINDYQFGIIPRPRFKSMFVSDGSNHYVLGGSNDVSQFLSLLERIDSSSDPFAYTKLSNMDKAKTAMSAVIGTVSAAPFSNNNHIFVAGGFEGGRGDGFLRINSSYSPTNMSLNGKQSIAVDISLTDENGDAPSSEVRLNIRGFLRFIDESSSTDQELVNQQQSEAAQKLSAALVDQTLTSYPVLFTRDDITTSGGKAVITLLPRSDDILNNIQDLIKQSGATEVEVSEQETSQESLEKTFVINTGVVRRPYTILVQVTVVDDFFYGQTIENINAEFEDGEFTGEDRTPIEEETEETTAEEIIVDDKFCEQVDVTVSWQSVSKGLSLREVNILRSNANAGGAAFFSLIPSSFAQLPSPLIPCIGDIDWIPSITRIISDHEGTLAEMTTELDNLNNQIPFGASALFDSIISASTLLSDNDLDTLRKNIYVFTDNESNMSFNTIGEVVESVNAIDGEQQTPVVFGNYSVVSPVTLSSRANTTDVNNLNNIASQTGGQSSAVLSAGFEDETVQLFVAQTIGSLGYGLYEFIFDAEEIIKIDTITALFQLYSNTAGTWVLSTSTDSYNFTDVGKTFVANDQISFANLSARYFKFTVVLTTGFTAFNDEAYETIPLPGSPTLLQIEILADTAKTAFLFLSTEKAETTAQQVVVATNTSNIDSSNTSVGIAKSDSHNWTDYQSEAQPSVDQNGKIFIPIRNAANEDAVPYETLDRIDGFIYKATYGRWDTKSIIIVIDSGGNTISSSLYKTFPRDGIIIFAYPQIGPLKMKVANTNNFRVGFKLQSRASDDPLEIYGIGYMYNTNIDLLPISEPIKPEAEGVTISPLSLTPYSQVAVSYTFTDVNNNSEDISNRKIRWFVNNVRLPYLDDLTTWNDFSNANDPLYSNALTFALSDVVSTEAAISKAKIDEESILKVGDIVQYTIQVYDGVLLSDKVKSDFATVYESAPEVNSVTIKAETLDGIISNILTSSDIAIVVTSLISDSDTNNSEIIWFVNGLEFKRGNIGINNNIDRIVPGELNNEDVVALLFNNQLFVEVTPFTDNASGNPVASETIIVQNSKPLITDVVIQPANPLISQSILLTYTFVDTDVAFGSPTQSDQSTVVWEVASSATENQFVAVDALNNQTAISATNTNRGERWRATITPFDGLDSGEPQITDIVVIR